MNRRGVLAAAAVALVEIKTAAASPPDNRPPDNRPPDKDKKPVPCTTATDCPAPATSCLDGFCFIETTSNNTITLQPLLIVVSRRRRRRRKGGRRRR